MPEAKKEEKKQQLENVECNETRRFRYSNDENNVSFEFEIDVSNPETALTEISDFKDLMAQSFNDLDILSKEFVAKIEKPAKKEEKKEVKKSDGPVEATASKQ